MDDGSGEGGLRVRRGEGGRGMGTANSGRESGGSAPSFCAALPACASIGVLWTWAGEFSTRQGAAIAPSALFPLVSTASMGLTSFLAGCVLGAVLAMFLLSRNYPLSRQGAFYIAAALLSVGCHFLKAYGIDVFDWAALPAGLLAVPIAVVTVSRFAGAAESLSASECVLAFYVPAWATGQVLLPLCNLLIPGVPAQVAHVSLVFAAWGLSGLAARMSAGDSQDALCLAWGGASADMQGFEGSEGDRTLYSWKLFSTPRKRMWAAVGVYACAVGSMGGLSPNEVTPEQIVFCRIASSLLVTPFLLALRKRETARGVCREIVRMVFPLTVLSYMLLSQLDGTLLLVVVSLSFFSGTYCMLLVYLGTAVVCRQAGLPPGFYLAKMAVVQEMGTLAGSVLGFVLGEFSPLNGAVLSAVATVVFLGLVVVTFEMGVQEGAKTLWGLEENHSPRAFHDQRLLDACKSLAREAGLSRREAEMVTLLAQGATPKKMADDLVLSITTIRTHIASAYRKLDVHSADELREMIRTRAEGRD